MGFTFLLTQLSEAARTIFFHQESLKNYAEDRLLKFTFPWMSGIAKGILHFSYYVWKLLSVRLWPQNYQTFFFFTIFDILELQKMTFIFALFSTL